MIDGSNRYPPGVETLFLDIGSSPAWISELYGAFGEVKKRWLGNRKYWYLNLVARQPSRGERGESTHPLRWPLRRAEFAMYIDYYFIGLVRAAMEPYLQKASEEGLPVWIEATTEHSRDVYAHLGFQLIDEVKIGAGKADRDGNARFGGEGATVYCMIAEPKT